METRTFGRLRRFGLGRFAASYAAAAVVISVWLTTDPAAQARIPAGFVSLLDGQKLTAWHVSKTNSHGSTPDWHIDGGSLIGAQHPAGKGGILLTNRRYGNVEVYLELKPDYGCDGGLFFRSDEAGNAYQVMLDYVPGGSMGGIYGEGLKDVTGTPADAWQQYWKTNTWNTLRARIEGAVPHIQVWLNEHQITDWTDTANHATGGSVTGMIALQVHAGDRWKPGGVHRFRAVAVRELPPPQ
jgi:hypothetical protein